MSHTMSISASGEKFAVHHDGDFGGDIEIIMDAGRALPVEGHCHVSVRVPFAVFVQVTAEAVRQRRISDLEQAADAGLLGLG